MLERGINAARKALQINIQKANQMSDPDQLETARKQQQALEEVEGIAKETLEKFGVPDIVPYQ